MNKHTVHSLAIAALLCLVSPLAVHAEEAKDRKQQADIEARLAAARQRLEAAAREIAELNGQRTDRVTRDVLMTRGFERPRASLGIDIGWRGERGRRGARTDDAGKEERSAKDVDRPAGVYVEGVLPEGPAAKAGIKTGDVLVSLNGKSLKDSATPSLTLIGGLRDVTPGDKVKVDYLRDGKTHSVEIVTEAMDFHRFGWSPDRAFMGWPGAPGVPGTVPGAAFFQSFVAPGALDMELVTLTPKLGRYFGADRGVLVVRGPRDSALKLEEGDVIVDIDGRQPQSGAHALRILRSYQAGEKVAFNVLRDKKKLSLTVTIPKDREMGRAWTRPLDPGSVTGATPALPPLPPLPHAPNEPL